MSFLIDSLSRRWQHDNDAMTRLDDSSQWTRSLLDFIPSHIVLWTQTTTLPQQKEPENGMIGSPWTRSNMMKMTQSLPSVNQSHTWLEWSHLHKRSTTYMKLENVLCAIFLLLLTQILTQALIVMAASMGYDDDSDSHHDHQHESTPTSQAFLDFTTTTMFH